MKTRIYLATAALCLVAMTARAQASLDNASTPEAIIGQCPDLPSAGTLAALSNDNAAAYEAVRLFLDKMEKIGKRLREIMDAAEETSKKNLTQAAGKQVRQLTGKSLDEVQNMSEGELERMGMGIADKQLKQMGIKKSAAQLAQQGELSEAEQQQMAEDVMKKMSGLSMKELQALQNMSEEEQMAYMQQGGRTERMQKAAAGVKQPASSAAKNAKSLMEISEEMKKTQEQWSYIDDVYQKERKEMVEEMRRIIAKYEAQMPPESGRILDKYFGTVLLTYHTKAEQKLIERLRLTCSTECFTLWRNLISKRQGQLKIRLTDCPRLDELSARQRELQGMAAEVPTSAAFGVTEEYLKITKEVAGLPWELYSTKTEAPQPES